MARPYSVDLRQRVLQMCENGTASRAEIAAIFSISESTLYNWLRQARQGCREPKPRGGGRKTRIDEHGLETLRGLVRQGGMATLADYVERFAGLTDLRISIPTMHRMLRRLEAIRCDGRPRAFVGVAQEDADTGD